MNTNIPTEIQEIAKNIYRTIRQENPITDTITLLHIADEYTLIAQGTDDKKPEKLWLLDIGTEKTAHEFFKHNPPTPGEVENAITVVEDEVMPLHKLLEPSSTLYSFDSSIYKIALQTISTEQKNETILSRSDMEQIFDRLAAIISGRPASTDILPTENSFAATLLILREVMHHLGFKEIIIKP